MNHEKKNKNRSQHPINMRPFNTFGVSLEQNQNYYIGPFQSQFIYPGEEIEILGIKLTNGLPINCSDLAALTQIKSNSEEVLSQLTKLTKPSICQGCFRIKGLLESAVKGLNKLCEYTFEQELPSLKKGKIERMDRRYNQFSKNSFLELLKPYLIFFTQQFEKNHRILKANLLDQQQRIKIKDQCFYFEIDYQKNNESFLKEKVDKLQEILQSYQTRMDQQKQRWAAQKQDIQNKWNLHLESIEMSHRKMVEEKEQFWKTNEKKQEARVKILREELGKVRNQLDQCKINLEILISQKL